MTIRGENADRGQIGRTRDHDRAASQITGHQSVSILLNHYFKPDRDDLRRVLQEKMPKMFSVGRAKLAAVDPIKCALVDRLKAMSAENWTAIRDELLAEIEGHAASKAAEIILLK